MKTQLPAFIAALLLGLAAGCGPAAAPPPSEPAAPSPAPSPAPAPSPSPSPAPAPSPSPAPSGAQQQQPVAGGYTAQDPASPDMQAAATKAVELLKTRASDPSLTLGKVLSAQTQVVAGLNYRLRVELGSASGPQTLTLTLYRDLQGGYQLTAVER